MQSSDKGKSKDAQPLNASDETGREGVLLPEGYEQGELYTTVERGNASENLFASRETIEAVQNGEAIPDESILTLEIYRDGTLDDIFVMEKRVNWNDQVPPDKRNGDWRFQAFKADGSVNTQRDIGSCISCHATQERDDYICTPLMK